MGVGHSLQYIYYEFLVLLTVLLLKFFFFYLYGDHMKLQEKTGWGRISSACSKQKDSRVLILYPKHMSFQRSIISLLVSVNRY